MSSINANFSVNSTSIYGDLQQRETEGSNGTNDPNKSITITMYRPDGTPVTASFNTQLQIPMINLDDIPINELTQQIEGLDKETFQLLSNYAGFTTIVRSVGEMADQIAKSSPEDVKSNLKEIESSFKDAEGALEQAGNSMLRMLESGSYPSYADFMKMMIEVSQELRKLAAEIRHASVEGEIENIIEQSKTMKKAAEERYDAAQDKITGDRINAGMQIGSGAFTLAATGGSMALGGAGGAIGAKSGAGLTGFIGGASSAGQTGATIGQGMGGMTTGSGSLVSAEFSQAESAHQKEGEFLDAARKNIEAGQKLLQQNQEMTKELSETAKQLRDMILSLYRDFISSQNQIIQRANV